MWPGTQPGKLRYLDWDGGWQRPPGYHLRAEFHKLYCACVNVEFACLRSSQVMRTTLARRPHVEKEGLRGPPSSIGQRPWRTL